MFRSVSGHSPVAAVVRVLRAVSGGVRHTEKEGLQRRPAPERSGRPAGVLGLAGGGQSASTCCRTGLARGGCSVGILPTGSPPRSAPAQERRDPTSDLTSACGLVSWESAAMHVV